MAYLRGDYYIWGDGEDIHVCISKGAAGGGTAGPEYEYDSVHLPYEVLDEYVVMRFAELLYKGDVESAIERALQHGNFGAAILRENAKEIEHAVKSISIQSPRNF